MHILRLLTHCPSYQPLTLTFFRPTPPPPTHFPSSAPPSPFPCSRPFRSILSLGLSDLVLTRPVGPHSARDIYRSKTRTVSAGVCVSRSKPIWPKHKHRTSADCMHRVCGAGQVRISTTYRLTWINKHYVPASKHKV